MSTTQDTIQQLMKLNRESLHLLVDVECVTPEDHARLCEVQTRLSEQINLLMQLRDESGGALRHSPRQLVCHNRPGAGKGSYLNGTISREEYISLLKRIFQTSFNAGGKFVLPDGSTVSGHRFLACLYDIGISRGIATASRQVKAFFDLVSEAVRDTPAAGSFQTAYNTVQMQIRRWRDFVPLEKNSDGEVLLHNIEPFSVRPEHRTDYSQWMQLRDKVEHAIG